MYKCKDKDKVVGKHYLETRDEKHGAKLKEIVNKVLKGEAVAGVPCVRKDFDGSTGKHILSANPVYDDSGEIVGVEGFIIDIKEGEELTEHISYTVRNSAAGYYRLDEKGNIVDVNDAWLKLYKYDSKDEIIGKHFSVARDKNEVSKLQNTFDRVMSGETISGVVAVRKCKDGSKGKHILSANPITIGNKIVGMEGFILDITNVED